MSEQQEQKYVHNSEYNKRLLKVASSYHALLKIQLKAKLKELQEGARNIANNSKNPELLKVCSKLDQLEIK